MLSFSIGIDHPNTIRARKNLLILQQEIENNKKLLNPAVPKEKHNHKNIHQTIITHHDGNHGSKGGHKMGGGILSEYANLGL